jgi:hypothetical protein
MSAFSSPDRAVRDRSRGAGMARAGRIAPLLLLLVSFGAGAAEARTHHSATAIRTTTSSSGASASTAASASADSGRAVTGVTISGEGIRIQGDQRTIRVKGTNGNPDVNIDINVDDSTMNAMGYGHHGSGDIVQMFQDVHVARNQVVDGDVVAIFGNVDVQGIVMGQVVAVLGSVTAEDSSRIGGDVVTVGGTVRSSPTAVIQGQTVAAPGIVQTHMARWLPGAAMIASVFFFAILGALIALLFPERLVRVATTVSRRTFLSFLLGLLAFPALPVVLVVLCITVVGIPVAVLLLFLFPVAVFMGYVASSALMGARISRQEVTTPPVWRNAILGLVFVGIFFVVGGVLTNLTSGGFLRVLGVSFLGLGLVIASVSSLLGLGALFLSRLGEPEREQRSAVPGAAPGLAPGYAPPTS